jgi:ATP-dependent RNA helicase DeaD
MDSVKIVILDEADEMLDMGFRDDIEVILKDTPSNRQTIMFSATMSKEIMQLTKNYQKNPVVIDVTHHKINAPKIDQIYYEMPEKAKPEALARLIDLYNIKLALVFCNTKRQVDDLVELLKVRGYLAEALHGGLSQKQRDKVMGGFKSGSVEILVATDVAGRGIDVNNVEAVFNYDLPRDDEDYVHRIGRTGRAGKSGTAFTFITGRQIYNLKRIEKLNNIKIKRMEVPTIDDLEETRINSYKEKIKTILDMGHLTKYINYIDNLMGDDYASIDIAAALLKLMMTKENTSFDNTVKFRDDRPFIQTKINKKKSNFERRKKFKNKNEFDNNRRKKNKKRNK